MIGVKGRIQSRNIEASDGNRKTITEIVAEKVTFLSPQTEKES
jgi:single-stranded DNA-binding protein